MQKPKQARSLIIFYILVGYIFVQFCWWAFHIVSLNQEIYHLKRTNQPEVPDLLTGKQELVEDSLNNKIWMVVGEGSVFLLLLIVGAVITRNSFIKEVALGNQQKNFLHSVTHELKSPIASVKLYIETLLKRDLEREKQKEILVNTLSETERLFSLVENILFSAKIESGTFSLYPEKINISKFTNELISVFVARFSGRETHQIALNIEPDVFLFTDKNAYSSIILNLVENSVKYSPRDSKIFVGLKESNDHVFVSVADEGTGISEEEKENIFKKFYRVGNEESRKTKGTGLGLYIVKQLVGRLGGTICVKNNIGKGSIFEVKFKI